MPGLIASSIWDSGWLNMIVARRVMLSMLYLWWTIGISLQCLRSASVRPKHVDLYVLVFAGPTIAMVAVATNFVNNTFSDSKIAILIGILYAMSLSVAFRSGDVQ